MEAKRIAEIAQAPLGYPRHPKSVETTGLAGLPNGRARMGLSAAETKLMRFLEHSFESGRD